MAVTAYKYAGTAANVDNASGIEWINPDYAKADGTDFSTVAAPSSKKPSDYLTLTNFGFTSSDIPAGSTIDGIEFAINRYFTNANDVFDYEFQLLKASTAHGSNMASAAKWPSSEAEATYGGATNLCGGTWAQTDIADSGFGVRLCIKATSGGAGTLAYVDYIKLRVYYTEGGGGGTLPLKNVFNRPFRGVFR